MKIFLDTADVEAIRARIDSGVVDGVTTNPSIIMKSGKPFEPVAREILEIVTGSRRCRSSAGKVSGST